MAPRPSPIGDTRVPSSEKKTVEVGNHSSMALSAWKTRSAVGLAR